MNGEGKELEEAKRTRRSKKNKKKQKEQKDPFPSPSFLPFFILPC